MRDHKTRMHRVKVRTIALHGILLLGAVCVMKASEASPKKGPDKPNIVFVLFDDMGYGQPQSYNSESALHTPNFDRFAKEGMQFTDAHSAASVCTPTRYGVLTGRYPSRIGKYGVLGTYSAPIIPKDRMTVASLLKQQGYATACIGKWHLGMNWDADKEQKKNEGSIPVGTKMTGGPNDLGFDYFFGYTHARNIGTIIEQDRVVVNVDPVENQPQMIKKAVEWLDQRKTNEPFFLYFPICPPHMPVIPSSEYLGKSGAEDLVKHDPNYGDWLYQGDAMLGQILATLEKNHLADNTIVFVASDNGAEHRAYDPLRDSKRSIYEGGHRVPFAVRWPGQVKPGSVNAHTICLNDLMATAAAVTGATVPDNAGEDSVNLLPELLGASKEGVHEATVHQSSHGDLAIRKGPWKLIFKADGTKELYNIETDLSESKDLTATQPQLVSDLTVLMQRYIDTGRSTPGAPQTNSVSISLAGRKQGKAEDSGEPE